MKILKVINNNVVGFINENAIESIAMGKGLGFSAKPGDTLNEDKVEKIFHLENQSETNHLTDLLTNTPEEYIDLCNRIITYATETLGKELNPRLYLTLTDHVSFAIYRIQQGIQFQNALLNEVRIFYPREFAIGKYALVLIKRELGVVFPEDEAASIAIHIVNAQLNNSISNTMYITNTMQKILEILSEDNFITIKQDSCYFDEFIEHLKFLTMQTFNGKDKLSTDLKFVNLISRANPKEYKYAKRIADYLEKESNNTVSNENIAYLAVQIHRIRSIHDCKK